MRTAFIALLVSALVASGCASPRVAVVTDWQAQGEVTSERDLVWRVVRVRTADATYEGRVLEAKEDGGVRLQISEAGLLEPGTEVLVPYESIEDLTIVASRRNLWLAAGTALGVAGIFALVRIIHPKPTFDPADTALHNNGLQPTSPVVTPLGASGAPRPSARARG